MEEFVSYVYIAKITDSGGRDFIKIGSTGETPKSRITSLQTGSPFKITLENFYKFPKGKHKEIERAIHSEMELFNTCGEWFLINDSSFVKISEIKSRLKKFELVYCEDYLNTALEKIEGSNE